MGIDSRQVRPVEEIEDLKPELEVNPFGNTGVFVEVDVRFGKVRSAELARLFIALRTESGSGELCRRENPIEKGGASIPLVVIGRIRIVEPNTVDELTPSAL